MPGYSADSLSWMGNLEIDLFADQINAVLPTFFLVNPNDHWAIALDVLYQDWKVVQAMSVTVRSHRRGQYCSGRLYFIGWQVEGGWELLLLLPFLPFLQLSLQVLVWPFLLWFGRNLCRHPCLWSSFNSLCNLTTEVRIHKHISGVTLFGSCQDPFLILEGEKFDNDTQGFAIVLQDSAVSTFNNKVIQIKRFWEKRFYRVPLFTPMILHSPWLFHLFSHCCSSFGFLHCLSFSSMLTCSCTWSNVATKSCPTLEFCCVLHVFASFCGLQSSLWNHFAVYYMGFVLFICGIKLLHF